MATTTEIMLNILGGIIAGLLTSLLVFVGTFVWKSAIQPWIQNILYKGIRVDGTWTLVENDGTEYEQHETLELIQHAGKVSGRLILTFKNDTTASRTLVVDGVVRDGFVILTAVPASDRNLGYLAYVGRVAGDGNSIQGHASYLGITTDNIEGLAAKYKRC